jgi:hypothetical protein
MTQQKDNRQKRNPNPVDVDGEETPSVAERPARQDGSSQDFDEQGRGERTQGEQNKQGRR